MTSTLQSNFTESEKDIFIHGSVVFNSVSSLLRQWNQLNIDHKTNENQSFPIVVDCSSMDKIDSAGIALFLDWKRQCIDKGLSFHFRHLPEQARSLIEAYRLQSVLTF